MSGALLGVASAGEVATGSVIAVVYVQRTTLVEHRVQVLRGFLGQVLHTIAQKDHLLVRELLQRQVVPGGHQFLEDVSPDLQGAGSLRRQVLVFYLLGEDASVLRQHPLLVLDPKAWIFQAEERGVGLNERGVGDEARRLLASNGGQVLFAACDPLLQPDGLVRRQNRHLQLLNVKRVLVYLKVGLPARYRNLWTWTSPRLRVLSLLLVLARRQRSQILPSGALLRPNLVPLAEHQQVEVGELVALLEEQSLMCNLFDHYVPGQSLERLLREAAKVDESPQYRQSVHYPIILSITISNLIIYLNV